MTHFSETEQLIDALMEHWLFWDLHEEYYLTKLVPDLVSGKTQGDAVERVTLNKLRQLLNQEEWLALPKLIAEKRAGILREIEIERARRNAQEKEEQEVARLAAVKREEEEHERLRQESLRKQVEATHNELLHEIRRRLHSNYLSADSFFRDSCSNLIAKDEYEQEKISFVKSWIAENTPLSKNGEKQLPDDEQAAAIAAAHGHLQVVARAGSGKTTTLVNRALFLLKHCGITPSEMLLLAFNRKAALEIRRRLLALLGEGAEAAVAADVDCRIREASKHKRIDRDEIEANALDAVATKLNVTLPHIMTFHALAYAIVHPEESLLYNGAEGESQGLSRVIQQVIDDHFQIPSIKDQVRELMLAHFREDWDRIIDGHYDRSKDELLQYRRSLPRESLGGEYVKSFGEKIIADFLFEHDIPYKYERNYWWNGINYRPDFTIFQTSKSGIIIEYFGLKGDADYDEMSDEKRAYWDAKQDWTLIEFSPQDIASSGPESFLAALKERLQAQGIPCIRLSEDEIWDRIRDRAIDRFTKATVGFIGRCRKRSLSESELRSLINGYSPLSPVEEIFLNLAHRLYISYLGRLSATGEDDFDGLMQRAADSISAGQTLFQRISGSGDLALLRYVCIDEFQDFSDLFYRLLNAIRKQNPRVELFCVGDDWQAINGFAGSDLRFFENFTAHIGKSRQLYISTNYRSSKAIVDIGNSLMVGLGKPAIAHKKSTGKVFSFDLNKFEPSKLEEERHGRGDNITPAVLRLTSKSLADGLDVVMLCRRNAIPWFVNYQDQEGTNVRGLARYLDLIRSFFPKGMKERISISTAHKYKGLEKPMVIVLDAVARSYPLIHPDWAFSRVLGDSPEKITKEERRLFYVALTRAIEKLVIITDGRSKSPFLEELERRHPLSPLKWSDYPPVRGAITCVVVKIGNHDRRGGTPTFAIKDLLKATGYQWQSTGWPGWAKSFPTDGFNIEAIKKEVWNSRADGIEVRIFDDTDKLAARFLINAGDWQCEIDQLATICAAKEESNNAAQRR